MTDFAPRRRNRERLQGAQPEPLWRLSLRADAPGTCRAWASESSRAELPLDTRFGEICAAPCGHSAVT